MSLRLIAIAAWCGFLIAAGTTWSVVRGSVSLAELAMGLVVTGVGLILIGRVPGNRVSWLIMLVGVVWSWMYLGNALTVAEWRDLFPEPIVVAFVWAGHWLWFVGLIALVFAMFRFPDGAFVSSRWRWAWWTGVAGSVLVVLGSAFGPFQTDSRFFDAKHRVLFVRADLTMSNPLEIGGADLLLIAGAVPVVAFSSATIVSLFVRYRRASTRQRAQIRWVGFAATLALATYLLGGYVVEHTPVDWDVLTLVMVAAIPVAITVAITRYRLYDIDRIVSRTVTYSIVIGGLALVFAVGAVWLPQQLPTANNNLAVAASTLAVAALFNPLRRRVQRIVDRRFNRLPYDPETVARRLEAELRDAVDAVAVGTSLNRIAAAALHPQASVVWVRRP